MTAEGTWRHLGDPPAGVTVATPTLDDGYLLLAAGDRGPTMNAPALRQATLPTTRAIAWSPLLVVGGVLLAVAAALRLLDSPPGSVLVLGAAAMAAVLVFSLRDPAAALLAAVPISRFQRRALRLALVGTVALPAVAAGRRRAARGRGGPRSVAGAGRQRGRGRHLAPGRPGHLRGRGGAAGVGECRGALRGQRGPGERRTHLVADRPVVGHRRGGDAGRCSGGTDERHRPRRHGPGNRRRPARRGPGARVGRGPPAAPQPAALGRRRARRGLHLGNDAAARRLVRRALPGRADPGRARCSWSSRSSWPAASTANGSASPPRLPSARRSAPRAGWSAPSPRSPWSRC